MYSSPSPPYVAAVPTPAVTMYSSMPSAKALPLAALQSRRAICGAVTMYSESSCCSRRVEARPMTPRYSSPPSASGDMNTSSLSPTLSMPRSARDRNVSKSAGAPDADMACSHGWAPAPAFSRSTGRCTAVARTAMYSEPSPPSSPSQSVPRRAAPTGTTPTASPITTTPPPPPLPLRSAAEVEPATWNSSASPSTASL